MLRSILAAIALVIAAGVPPAGAQNIYKYVGPDGRVIYSDKPVPGARLEEELELPPPPDPAVVEAARARRDAVERAADQRSKSLAEASAELRQWTTRLEETKAQLAAGQEPLPGERTGTYQGKSRMNAAYWARQKANEDAVWEAEARIKQAQAAINAAR